MISVTYSGIIFGASKGYWRENEWWNSNIVSKLLPDITLLSTYDYTYGLQDTSGSIGIIPNTDFALPILLTLPVILAVNGMMFWLIGNQSPSWSGVGYKSIAIATGIALAITVAVVIETFAKWRPDHLGPNPNWGVVGTLPSDELQTIRMMIRTIDWLLLMGLLAGFANVLLSRVGFLQPFISNAFYLPVLFTVVFAASYLVSVGGTLAGILTLTAVVMIWAWVLALSNFYTSLDGVVSTTNSLEQKKHILGMTLVIVVLICWMGTVQFLISHNQPESQGWDGTRKFVPK